MKKTLFLLLACLLLLLPVQAAGQRLVDNAALLTTEEQTQLRQQLDSVSQSYGVDLVIVTVNSLEGKAISAYADDFFDYGGYGSHGVLLLVDMGSRQWYISTTGSCISTFSDSIIDHIGESTAQYLSDGDYEAAFSTFISHCESVLEDPEGYEGDSLTGGERLVIALIVGFVIALIAVMIMKGQLKSVRQKSADAYQKDGSFHLTQAYELFLYSNVTRTQKQSSSTHTGSSGRSHGGGGGRF